MRCDRLWRNARLATLAPDQPGLGEIDDGVIACKDGVIVFAGRRDQAPAGLDAERKLDCDGRWITPGLIDCHTHLVHGGDRAEEFERRLCGASYAEIARAGGGILSTVRATRAATEAELVATALPRLDALLAEGVTTLEIKSGYGLSLDAEIKQLRAVRALGQLRPISLVPTLLAAHTIPPEFANDADAYITLIADTIIPAIAATGLAVAVDGFCESIGFSPAQIRSVFAAAARHGLPVKLHADQLSDLGGAALAAEFGALSADHLEYASAAGIRALAAAGTVAVLLPGAFYGTHETHLPPIDLLRRHGVSMALATDCNPGSSPLTSLLLAMNLAATLFGLSVAECLAGVTRAAAGALGLGASTGTLEAGKDCDLALWDIERPVELVYRMGFNPLHARDWRGQ